METLYEKVIIKSEADLPKEGFGGFVCTNDGKLKTLNYGSYNKIWWMECVDWYLRPLPQPERKTAEEILEKYGLYQIELNGHKYSGDIIEAMQDYAVQGIDWPSEEEIKKWAYSIKLASLEDINPDMEDVELAYRCGLINGAKWLLNRVKK